nr:MAG TPA: light-harvesting protein subunit alpha [Caudoviricetes sp.]
MDDRRGRSRRKPESKLKPWLVGVLTDILVAIIVHFVLKWLG